MYTNVTLTYPESPGEQAHVGGLRGGRGGKGAGGGG